MRPPNRPRACRTAEARIWSGEDLREVDLRGADLRGANLSNADLAGANLRGADLRGVRLWVAGLSGILFSGADLRGAYLADAILDHVDRFAEADLRGVQGCDRFRLLPDCSGDE